MANTGMFVNDFEADEKSKNSDVAFNSSVKPAIPKGEFERPGRSGYR
jgi:hypothetical protein